MSEPTYIDIRNDHRYDRVNRSGYLVLYVNAWNEIRPVIIEASTLDDAKQIIEIRGLKKVFYIKSLKILTQ